MKPQEPNRSSDDLLARRAAAWFARMHSGQVTPSDHAAFRRWLSARPAHKEAYDEIQSLWTDLGQVADPRTLQSSPAVLPSRDRQASSSRFLRMSRARWGALAACLLVAVWMTFGGVQTLDRLQADYHTSPGERRLVTLPDGSQVQLNTDTALTLDFTAGHRRVRLIGGEAFFDVVHDAGRPFEVAAGDGLTRVTGTRFNVREVGSSVTVTVVSGSVEVLKHERADARPSPVRLAPGQAAEYQSRQPVISTHAADEKRVTSWREGKLIFADRPLKDVLMELERYRRGSILVMDEDIANTHFTGVINLEDIDAALDIIEATLPADVLRVSDYLVLVVARG